MFYKLTYDMDMIDKTIEEGTNYIYAETTNMDDIEYKGFEKGFFDNIILAPQNINDWPEVVFYFSSKVSERESDYLLNIKRWPIIHNRVIKIFNEMEIKGLKYFPIKLIDVVTGNTNENYFLVYIENFIDGFDMQKSKYRYNEKYDLYTFIPKQTFLDEDVCSGYDIFRCSKSVASIYISVKVKKIIEINNMSGFYFDEQL